MLIWWCFAIFLGVTGGAKALKHGQRYPGISQVDVPVPPLPPEEPRPPPEILSPFLDFPPTNPFDENRQSILQWIQNLLSTFGVGQSEQTPPVPPTPVNLTSCAPCSCGVTNQKNRIVGGNQTQITEYPWMALLMYHGEFYCGGTLISTRYVLTAAHCVNGFKVSKIRVRLLEHDQTTENETQIVERGVSRVIRHLGYSPLSLDNDIAIIQLKEDVELTEEFMPACIPPLKKSFAGEIGIVTGWGVTSFGQRLQKLQRSLEDADDDTRGHISPVLQELEVPIMSNEECRKKGYSKNQITENMLCAGYDEGGKDSCQGDSGGPLHVVNSNSHVIAGVVSWGQGCARPNYPGVYTRVNRYVPWIMKYTADSCPCSPREIPIKKS